MSQPNTHLGIDRSLCGTPTAVSDGSATVELTATAVMAADDRGLVHGGFVFGAADYAAMLAVNDPNVVLGSANVMFKAPIRVGERVLVKAELQEAKGKKRQVEVTAHVGATRVLEGTFTCFVLEQHVLNKQT